MKPTSLIIIPLLVLAPTLAYATNESSYKFGLQIGFSDYNSIPHPNHEMVNLICDEFGPVTNSTACSDGYMHGWLKWCLSDIKDYADTKIPTPNHNYIIESNSNLFHP